MEYQELTPEQTISLEREQEKIKKEITRIEKSIKIGDTLRNLMEDPKFKEVFIEYYLKDEVIRETMLLSEKYFLEADQRQSLQDGLIAKAYFNDWINATVSMGALSESRLKEYRDRLKDIDTMLSAGIPITPESEALPPEGVTNG